MQTRSTLRALRRPIVLLFMVGSALAMTGCGSSLTTAVPPLVATVETPVTSGALPLPAQTTAVTGAVEPPKSTAKVIEADRGRAEAATVTKTANQPLIPPENKGFRDCPDCPEMIEIRPGTVEVRTLEEGQLELHKIKVAKGYAIGKFEVTAAEWHSCSSDAACAPDRGPASSGRGSDRRPVVNVSWNDAKQYVAWLSRKTGKTYRLLSEEEWEYAAQGGAKDLWFTSRTESVLKKIAWYGDVGEPQIVGTKKPNAFGLHDMQGNVAEWINVCADSFETGRDPDGKDFENRRQTNCQFRGGSWKDRRLYSLLFNTADPTHRSSDVGFRVARDLDGGKG